MEHLVHIHDLDAYRIDSRSKIEILEPCEECGKQDMIFLSWEEGKREEVLDKFLTGNDKVPLDVTKAYKEGQTMDELVLGTRIYFSITREMINGLYFTKSIDREKQLELLKENKINEKKQLKKIKKDSRKIIIKELFRH
jgi:ssDNA-binding Zn-finger/Zn-ribbon topoisomerase 1